MQKKESNIILFKIIKVNHSKGEGGFSEYKFKRKEIYWKENNLFIGSSAFWSFSFLTERIIQISILINWKNMHFKYNDHH